MDQERKKLLVFGYGLCVILSMISIRLGFKHGFHLSNFVLLGVAGCILFLTLFQLKYLAVIYKHWMKVAHVIGSIVTAVILTLTFFCLFGSIGLILRLLKKDLLNQKIDPQAQTYWHLRETRVFDKTNYSRQF